MNDPLSPFRVKARNALSRLRPQHVRILELAATDPGPGKENTNEVIAVELGLSVSSIEKHIRKARKIIGGRNRDEAIKQFIVLRTLDGTRNSDFRAMDVTAEIIEDSFSRIAPEVADQLKNSIELEELAAELRGRSDLKAFDYRFGRLGRVWQILIGAFIILSIAGALLTLLNQVDTRNRSELSATLVGDEDDATIQRR